MNVMATKPKTNLPAFGSEITFLSGSRKGCRGRVTRRVGRHRYYVVTLDYAPRDSEWRKGEEIHCTESTSVDVTDA